PVKNVLSWDDQMLRLYGITRERFSGAVETWQAALHPEDRVAANEEFARALSGEKDLDTEFRVRWPDGTDHTIHAVAQVQRHSSGQPLFIIGTNWDITARKQAEQDLLEMNR